MPNPNPRVTRLRRVKWLWLVGAFLSGCFVTYGAVFLAFTEPWDSIRRVFEVGMTISALALAISALNFVLAWRKESREREAAELSMEKTRLEIEKMRRDAAKT